MRDSLVYNTVKRLPIVLCLDISPTMGKNNRIENLNRVVKSFFDELRKDYRVRNAVEVAVITFSTDIEENTEFEPLGSLANKIFSVVPEGDANLSTAVLASIQKLEERVVELDNCMIGNYLPYFILVSDGDPDQSDDDSVPKCVGDPTKPFPGPTGSGASPPLLLPVGV